MSDVSDMDTRIKLISAYAGEIERLSRKCRNAELRVERAEGREIRLRRKLRETRELLVETARTLPSEEWIEIDDELVESPDKVVLDEKAVDSFMKRKDGFGMPA